MAQTKHVQRGVKHWAKGALSAIWPDTMESNKRDYLAVEDVELPIRFHTQRTSCSGGDLIGLFRALSYTQASTLASLTSPYHLFSTSEVTTVVLRESFSLRRIHISKPKLRLWYPRASHPP